MQFEKKQRYCFDWPLAQINLLGLHERYHWYCQCDWRDSLRIDQATPLESNIFMKCVSFSIWFHLAKIALFCLDHLSKPATPALERAGVRSQGFGWVAETSLKQAALWDQVKGWLAQDQPSLWRQQLITCPCYLSQAKHSARRWEPTSAGQMRDQLQLEETCSEQEQLYRIIVTLMQQAAVWHWILGRLDWVQTANIFQIWLQSTNDYVLQYWLARRRIHHDSTSSLGWM